MILVNAIPLALNEQFQCQINKSRTVEKKPIQFKTVPIILVKILKITTYLQNRCSESQWLERKQLYQNLGRQQNISDKTFKTSGETNLLSSLPSLKVLPMPSLIVLLLLKQWPNIFKNNFED